MFKLSSGVTVALRWTPLKEWGLALILATGSAPHLADLEAKGATRNVRLTGDALAAAHIDLSDENSVYAGLGLSFIVSHQA